MTRQEIISGITQVGRQVLPAGGHLWLYGSRARGDYHNGSDWDVLVLLDKERVDWSDYGKIAYPFTELSCNINETINPIIYTKKEWESYHFTPFYHNVQNDKIVLL